MQHIENKNSKFSARESQLDAHVMSIVDYYEDTGVTIQYLHFKLHIDSLVAKTRAKSAIIHKCFVSTDPPPPHPQVTSRSLSDVRP